MQFTINGKRSRTSQFQFKKKKKDLKDMLETLLCSLHAFTPSNLHKCVYVHSRCVPVCTDLFIWMYHLCVSAIFNGHTNSE